MLKHSESTNLFSTYAEMSKKDSSNSNNTNANTNTYTN
jgi:hypothetical protein